jgi:hypothetical protein
MSHASFANEVHLHMRSNINIARTHEKAGFHLIISKVATKSVKLAEMNGDCSSRDQTPYNKIYSLPKNPTPAKIYAKFSRKWK